MSLPSTPPGQLIAEKYRVLCKLGEGGMGEVLLAVHEPLGAKVAVKVLSAQGRTTADKKRFLLEAQAAAQLKSEHIAHVTDFGSLADGRQYMVMEYLEGEDLAARLHHRGRLPIAEAVDFVIEACAGLAEAHASGIIHRDIKPSNLFVTKATDGTEMIKVLDFGVSKFELGHQNAHALTSTGLAVGTPLYMSPEQVKTKKVIDARSDVWSLGVVLYELCRGKTPFYDESLGLTLLNVLEKPFQKLRDSGVDLSDELERIVDACLSKDPGGRPESVVALSALLAPFASEEGKRLAAKIPAISARASSRVLVSLPPSELAALEVTMRVTPSGAAVPIDEASGSGTTPSPDLTTGSVPMVKSRFTLPLLLLAAALVGALAVFGLTRGSGANVSGVASPSEPATKKVDDARTVGDAPSTSPIAVTPSPSMTDAPVPGPTGSARVSQGASTASQSPAVRSSAKAAVAPAPSSTSEHTLY